MSGRVEVLLSTYNGAKYLPELLDSVWAQDYPDVALSVRDDGSTDGATRALVEELLAGRTKASFAAGANLGAGSSFLTLLGSVKSDASYAAFCDQDDVWLPGKLSVAVRALEPFKGPALYSAAVRLVGEDLSDIRVHRRCVNGPSFENALVENIATGCTIVLNRPAIDLLSSRFPKEFLMHDAWCYLVVAGCGYIVYDPQPRVLYRLHDSNTVGVGTTLWAEWSGRLLRQVAEGHQRVLTRQAEELRRLYAHELRAGAARSLTDFLQAQGSFSQRLSYAFTGDAHRQRPMDDLIYRLLYVTHRI
jgi:glycosyltransferase involved in cell wall biosynthesis